MFDSTISSLEAVPVSWTIGRLNQAAFLVSAWRTSVGVLPVSEAERVKDLAAMVDDKLQ